MKSLGYRQTIEPISTAVSPCITSIGGVDGTLFDIRGSLVLSCIVCKEVV